MKDTSTTKQKSQATWFYPTLKTIREHHQMNRIQHLYVKVPRLLCTLGLRVISLLSIAETNPKSNHLSPDIKDRISRKAHRAFYKLSLLWAITGACIEDIIHQYNIDLHPFFKLDMRAIPEPSAQSASTEDRKTK